MKKGLSVAAILFVMIAYLGAQNFMGSIERRLSISSLTESGLGLSLFHQLAAESGARRLGVAYLHPDALKEIDTLVVASPLIEFSRHETDVIKGFVESGGLLVVSFHDEASWAKVKPLLGLADAIPRAEEDPSFVNGTTETLTADGRKVAAYGHLLFLDDACKAERVKCFLRAAPVGQGRVVAIAGLPFFSNSMLPLGDNAGWSADLLAHGGKFGFDEYHHYFSDKSAADLLAESTFTAPIIGLVAVILLFLAFGDRALYERTASPAPKFVRNYQELNTSFLRGALTGERGGEAALSKMAELLRRRYPNERIELQNERHQPGDGGGAFTAGRRAATLLAAHRRILLSKGRSARL